MAEHERVGREFEALGGLASLAGERVGGKKPYVFDILDPLDPLDDGVHLADMHGPAERPAIGVGPPTIGS